MTIRAISELSASPLFSLSPPWDNDIPRYTKNIELETFQTLAKHKPVVGERFAFELSGFRSMKVVGLFQS